MMQVRVNNTYCDCLFRLLFRREHHVHEVQLYPSKDTLHNLLVVVALLPYCCCYMTGIKILFCRYDFSVRPHFFGLRGAQYSSLSAWVWLALFLRVLAIILRCNKARLTWDPSPGSGNDWFSNNWSIEVSHQPYLVLFSHHQQDFETANEPAPKPPCLR